MSKGQKKTRVSYAELVRRGHHVSGKPKVETWYNIEQAIRTEINMLSGISDMVEAAIDDDPTVIMTDSIKAVISNRRTECNAAVAELQTQLAIVQDKVGIIADKDMPIALGVRVACYETMQRQEELQNNLFEAIISLTEVKVAGDETITIPGADVVIAANEDTSSADDELVMAFDNNDI